MSADDEINELKRIVEEEREAKRQRTKENQDRKNEWMRAYRAQHKEMHAEKSREYRDRQRATDPDYRERENARTRQSNRRIRERKATRPRPETCDVCNLGGRITFDHCHNSNKFRGWLCHNCNTALGLVRNDITVLEKLIIYLRTAENAQDE